MHTAALHLRSSVLDRHAQLPSPYQLFASRTDEGVLCAVRQDRDVPSFLHGEGWAFSGVLADLNAAPADFDLKAAQAGSALMGYYLFLALRP
jgi:hypothetical protein